VAFTSEDTNRIRHLWVQSLADPRATLLAQSEDALAPFFSPDGKSIAYYFEQSGDIKVVSIEGGTPRKISGEFAGGGTLGGCWSADGTIYAVYAWTAGIWKLSPTGMFPPEPFTKTIPQTERAHLWPNLSPDGKLLIYTVWNGGSFDTARIVVESLATRERGFIHVGASSAMFAGDDLIVFAQGGALLAAPFDAGTLRLKAQPQAVLAGVMMEPRDGGGQYALTRDGTLVYLPGANLMLPRRIVRVDRTGRVEPWSQQSSDFVQPTVAGDGLRVAIAQANSGELDIHVIERGHPLPLRLSLGGDDYEPAWSPDGRRVIWNSGREGEVQLYWRAVDGSDQEERLTTGPGMKHQSAFAPNGQAVAYTAPSGQATNPQVVPSGSANAGVERHLASAYGRRPPTLSAGGDASQRATAAVLARWPLAGLYVR
jgi:Tol biopolymer transport system component